MQTLFFWAVISCSLAESLYSFARLYGAASQGAIYKLQMPLPIRFWTGMGLDKSFLNVPCQRCIGNTFTVSYLISLGGNIKICSSNP
jgi:hypothetical protein